MYWQLKIKKMVTSKCVLNSHRPTKEALTEKRLYRSKTVVKAFYSFGKHYRQSYKRLGMYTGGIILTLKLSVMLWMLEFWCFAMICWTVVGSACTTPGVRSTPSPIGSVCTTWMRYIFV